MEQRRSKSIVQEESFRFAVKILQYTRRQRQGSPTQVLFKHALRSGTSIGANVEEALGGQSRKDFVAKLAIAAKEARETTYWLRLIKETQPHDLQELTSLLDECNSLVRMLNSIILTTRNKSRHSQPPDNSELRTQNSELETLPGNPDLRTQNSELHSNSEPKTQNSSPIHVHYFLNLAAEGFVTPEHAQEILPAEL